jgi:hypothetical protein
MRVRADAKLGTRHRLPWRHSTFQIVDRPPTSASCSCPDVGHRLTPTRASRRARFQVGGRGADPLPQRPAPVVPPRGPRRPTRLRLPGGNPAPLPSGGRMSRESAGASSAGSTWTAPPTTRACDPPRQSVRHLDEPWTSGSEAGPLVRRGREDRPRTGGARRKALSSSPQNVRAGSRMSTGPPRAMVVP